MKATQKLITAIVLCTFLVATYSCQQAGGEKTGSEFIPDMAHPVTYEANVYSDYSLNAWEKESVVSRRELSMPKKPVAGTVPRGYSSVGVHDGVFNTPEEAVANTMSKMEPDAGIAYTPNGSVPYYYPDTEEGRTLATEQIKYNPFPISKAGIAKGQELYNVYCGICHGEKGDGVGYLVRENGGKYPAQPANFLLDDLVNSSNGRYYHSIMYGKNAMGAYKDKLSYEERWQVIHYIRQLQAKEKKVAYSNEANELNPEFGVPASKMTQVAVNVPEEGSDMEQKEENHSESGDNH